MTRQDKTYIIYYMLRHKFNHSLVCRFHATEICFVCSHLAAHQKEFERRNQDYNDICDRMSFSQYECPNPDYPPTRNKRIKDFVWEGGKVFWVGDLNYRINDFDVEEVGYLLDKNICCLHEKYLGEGDDQQPAV